MENTMESWKHFLNKKVRCIINDAPSPYPKHKDGEVAGVTKTHLILKEEDKEIALLLSDIRRIEIREER